MTTASRRRTAIELPAIARRRGIFAMAEPTGDIAALGRTFGEFNSAITQRVDTIESAVDEVLTKLAGLTVHGGGGGNSQNNLKAELQAVGKYLRKRDDSDLLNIHRNSMQTIGDIQGNMSVGSDPDGGYFVLPTFSTTMTQKLWDVTAMRRLSRVETVLSGSQWEEPIDNDQVESGWVGENDPRPATKSPKIGKLKVPLNEAYAMPPVTQTLLDSVGFDLGGWLLNKISDKFGRDEGTAFLAGDGVGKPMGMLSYPTSTATDDTRPWGTIQYIATGQAGDLPTENPGDPLKSLVWALRAPYRPGAAFLLNSNTMSRIDKLKDGFGNYLLRPGLTTGAPSMLLGYPVEIDDVAMPDIGANAFAIAFGNFKRAYVIIDRIGLKLIIDPLTQKPLVLYYCYRRVGGALANSEAVKLLKFSAS